jgi:hypothetical protein
VTRIAQASPSSRPTVARGKREPALSPDPTGRTRAPGGGPKPLSATDPGLLDALDTLVDPDTRGDPCSPLRWTTKSLRQLADALFQAGHPVSPTTVGGLLHAQGYSLQRIRKTLEGAQHPDRDAQFTYLNAQAKAYLAAGQPVVSVDTKKKELVGDYANGGAECNRPASPSRSRCMISPTPPSARRSLTGSTTWAATTAGSASGPTTTPGSPWQPCAAGGPTSARPPTRPRTGCWSSPTPADPTATGSRRGRPSSHGSPPIRG